MSQHLQAIYDTRVAEGLLRPDPAQREVLLLLEELREKLEDRPAKPSGFLGRFFGCLCACFGFSISGRSGRR